MIRSDGRRPNQLRPVSIQTGYLTYAEGSALITTGNTRVLCAITVEERLPPFARGSGSGWVTAEYSMLPRSTQQRTPRDPRGGRPVEIQRLIGRSLRAITRLDLLGERTLMVDCDVLQADGGTRSAAITGAYVALYQALHGLMRRGVIPAMPLRCAVAATSAGVVSGAPLLDLNYDEDARAEIDFNVVMTNEGELVEVQGTGESRPFPRQTMNQLLDMAETGIQQLFQAQTNALAEAGLTESTAHTTSTKPRN